jgi:hypothetical protein
MLFSKVITSFEKVAANRSATAKEVKKILHGYLKSKKLDPEKAVLLAGGSMYFHGMKDHITDIDFLHPDLPEMFKKKMGKYELDGGPGKDANPKVWESQKKHGLKIQTPEALLAFYKMLNRPKDQEKIKFLEARLRGGK